MEEKTWQRRERMAREMQLRQLEVAVADMNATLALAKVEIHIRHGHPRRAIKAGRYMIEAADGYHRAGMGRRAEAMSRLAEKCRRAWLAHEAAEGFK